MSLPEESIILSRNIVAMAIESPDRGTPPQASLTQLPTGTEVIVVGSGFNSRTVEVRCKDRSYFVFVRDIEEPDSSYYLP